MYCSTKPFIASFHARAATSPNPAVDSDIICSASSRLRLFFSAAVGSSDFFTRRFLFAIVELSHIGILASSLMVDRRDLKQ